MDQHLFEKNSHIMLENSSNNNTKTQNFFKFWAEVMKWCDHSMLGAHIRNDKYSFLIFLCSILTIVVYKYHTTQDTLVCSAENKVLNEEYRKEVQMRRVSAKLRLNYIIWEPDLYHPKIKKRINQLKALKSNFKENQINKSNHSKIKNEAVKIKFNPTPLQLQIL